MNKTDKAVDDYLKSQNIEFVVCGLGFRFKSDFGGNDKPWACDEWRVTFCNVNKIQMDTEYYTGVGNRVLKPFYKNDPHSKKDFIAVKNHLTPKTEKNIGVLLVISEPVKPTAAQVLYSLIMDMVALNTSFEYWCTDYGYDSDKISHFNTYQKCCAIGKQMKQVFTTKQIEILREMLQDY